jgi:hypothetical protein
VKVKRSPQGEIDASESKIVDLTVQDNGIGFTQENRDSFDTLYSALKLPQGGKGFGRFICLKYFDELHVESVYRDATMHRRTFSMGKAQEIIVNERVSSTPRTSSMRCGVGPRPSRRTAAGGASTTTCRKRCAMRCRR